MRERRCLSVAKQPLLARNIKARLKELLTGQISWRIFITPEILVFRHLFFLLKHLITYFRVTCQIA